MQTDTIAAWQVEEGDWITLGSDVPWKVQEARDCVFMLMDEDGEVHEDNPVSLHPDEDVQLVVRWDDDDEEPFSDEFMADAAVDPLFP